MNPTSFDHVALWVSRRDEIADFLCAFPEMHVVDRAGDFTLLGAHARKGKVTLFDAEGPREGEELGRIVFRVRDLDAALARLPEGTEVERSDAAAVFEGPEGIGFGLVESAAADPDYDLDHAVLRVPDPEEAAAGLERLGFERRNGELGIADRTLRLEAGAAIGERPLLNHLAVLVDSMEEHRAGAEQAGFEVEEIKDAANTIAAFVRGPAGIRVEYVEHKPTFSLT